MPLLRRILAFIAGFLLIMGLAACTPTVSMQPAPDANNPLCATVTVALPQAIGDQERRWTDAQATGAWGPSDWHEPSSILLSCGVTVPAPTSELPCASLGGVDWLVDDSDTPNLRMTSYGRDPAVQVYVVTTVVSSNTVLTALGTRLSGIPATGYCTDPATLPG